MQKLRNPIGEFRNRVAEEDADGQLELLREDLCCIARGAPETMLLPDHRPPIHERDEFGARRLSTDCT